MGEFNREGQRDGSGLSVHISVHHSEDRTQYVRVNNAASGATRLTCGVPQGSVLGPILFSLYTTHLGRIIESHGLGRQLFADDSGMYDSFHPDDASISETVVKVESCCCDIKSWMSSNMLKLNEDKTEALLCGPKNKLGSLSVSSVCVGGAVIPFSSVIRDLGIVIDASLSMEDHISSVVRGCYFHLRSLGKLRPCLTSRAAIAIAVTLVISRLDYGNACLWGLPDKQLERLQHILNTAARIVTRTKRREHITPVLRQLHWLPVKQRIEHKVLSLCFKCMKDPASPHYLQEIIPRHNPPRRLRSSSQSKFCTPAVDTHRKKHLGFRAFSHCGPKLWNELPQDLRNVDSCGSFKRRLKMHLFCQYVGHCALQIFFPSSRACCLHGSAAQYKWTTSSSPSSSSSSLSIVVAESVGFEPVCSKHGKMFLGHKLTPTQQMAWKQTVNQEQTI